MEQGVKAQVSRRQIEAVAKELEEMGIVEQEENSIPANTITPQEALEISEFAKSTGRYSSYRKAETVLAKLDGRPIRSASAALICSRVYGIYQEEFLKGIITQLVDPENFLEAIKGSLRYEAVDYNRVRKHFNFLVKSEVISLPEQSTVIEKTKIAIWESTPLRDGVLIGFSIGMLVGIISLSGLIIMLG